MNYCKLRATPESDQQPPFMARELFASGIRRAYHEDSR
jgi:hypothetical protein